MRVTSAVRAYVRKIVLAKVADKLSAAEKAKKDAEDARIGKIREAKALCEKIRAEAQEKFVKEAKKLGLTFVPDVYEWNGDVKKGENLAMKVIVCDNDFVETMSRDYVGAKHNPCALRKVYYELLDEPERIRQIAEQAADKLLFELELGKVAKKELDEALRELEVNL